MINRIKKRIVRNFFSYYFKRKFFLTIVKLSKKPIFKKEGYWVAQQLLNRGYLDYAHEVIQHLPYKKHFDYIIRRIESMEEIKNNGLRLETTLKKPIEKISLLFAVHNSLPHDKAGYAIRTHMIAKNLIKKKIDIFVATRPGYPWDLQKHRAKDKNDKDIVNGVVYYRLLDNEKTFKKGSDFRYIDNYADKLVELAREKKSTIIHGHSNYLNGLAAIQASNILKIPSIYEIRGLWHLTRLTLDSKYKDAGMFDYEMEMVKGGAKSADVVVTISTALKELIVSWGIEEKKIRVIPNAVDISYFKPQKKSKRLIQKYNLEGKVIVGYIGSVTGYEGLKELVLAINQLVKDKLDIVLMIVGDGREKQRLEKISKTKNIIFTGRVPFDEVEEYYSLFDITPFPRNDYEVCRYVPPLKILEAMAMEKAVIVSNVAPLCEIIDDGVNGLVCETDNVESLKEKIVQLHHDISLRETLGKNSRVWVRENRSLEDMSLRYMALYNSLKDAHV